MFLNSTNKYLFYPTFRNDQNIISACCLHNNNVGSDCVESKLLFVSAGICCCVTLDSMSALIYSWMRLTPPGSDIIKSPVSTVSESVNHGIRNLICQTLCYTVKSKWGYFSILIWNINTSLHLHKLRNVRFYAPVVMFKLYLIIITTYKYTFTKKNITFCYLT